MTPDPEGRFTADDLDALAAIGRGNEWARSVLCTLARQGVALRRGEPDRSEAILDALGPWPWYKAGQFLFDLLEWEDFMVDGEPAPVVPTVLDAVALSRIGRLLRQAQGLVDGASGDPIAALQELDVSGLRAELAEDDLPQVEPGFHLYRDVVLGVFVSVGPLLRARREASPQDPAEGG